MEFAQILQRLWQLRVLVALGVVVAAFVAVASTYDVTVSTSDPVRERTRSFGAAHAVVYVDSPRSSLVTSSNDFDTLTSRAQIFARLIDSDDVKGFAARRLGVGVRDITVEGPFAEQPGAAQAEPVAQQRANQILGQGGGYSVFVDTEMSVPTITLFTQAPDGARAERLAFGIIGGLRRYVARLARAQRPRELERARDDAAAQAAQRDTSVSAAERRQQLNAVLDKGTVIRSTGPAVGGNVRDETGKVVVIAIFFAVLLGWCVVLLLLSGLVRTIRRR